MSIRFPVGSHSSFYESFFERAVPLFQYLQRSGCRWREEAGSSRSLPLLLCGVYRQEMWVPAPQDFSTCPGTHLPTATQDEGLAVQVLGDSSAGTGVLQYQSDAR